MDLIRLDTGASIELPEDLDWTDESAWTAVQQKTTRSLTGALIVQVAPRKQGGRPITLQGAEDRAWITRATLETLCAWRDVPGLEMTLVLHGTPRTVLFNHEGGAPVEAKPITFFAGTPQANDFYRLIARFLET